MNFIKDLSDNLYLIYMTACYFILATFTTVGYGDVLPIRPLSKLLSMTLMMFGTNYFGYTSSEIIQNIYNYKIYERYRKEEVTYSLKPKVRQVKYMDSSKREKHPKN